MVYEPLVARYRSPDYPQFFSSYTYHKLNTGSSKTDVGNIETYHSKTVKHIEMIEVLKYGETT
jgi:hypothetical protein